MIILYIVGGIFATIFLFLFASFVGVQAQENANDADKNKLLEELVQEVRELRRQSKQGDQADYIN